MSYDLRTQWPGVLARHADDCPARLGQPCTCGPLGYRGMAADPERPEPVVGPPLGTVEDASAWRSEHAVAMESWQAAAARGDTVDELVEDFLEAARSGRALDAHGEPYDPDELGELRWALHSHVAGELGSMRIVDVHGTELRRLVRRLDERGLSAEQTRSVVAAARALLRYAAQRGLVSWSAADTLILGDEEAPPQHRGTREMAPMAAVPAGYAPDLAGRRASPSSGMIPDEVIWMMLKIVAVFFVLIALVLAAESV